MSILNLRDMGKIIVKDQYGMNLIEAKQELRTGNKAPERETKGKRGLAHQREAWRLGLEAIGVMGGERCDAAMTSDDVRDGEGERKHGDHVGINQYPQSTVIVISGNPNLTVQYLQAPANFFANSSKLNVAKYTYHSAGSDQVTNIELEAVA